jgi:hypothetical protein
MLRLCPPFILPRLLLPPIAVSSYFPPNLAPTDLVGMRIAATACHDPRKGMEFWKYLAKLGVAQTGPSFFSTHPPSDDRAQVPAGLNAKPWIASLAS